jgi:hypothetical protein
MWSHGDVIEYRHVHHGRPWFVAPARVVEDNDERVVVWWPPETRYLLLGTCDRADGLRRLAENRWELEMTEWWGGPSLLVHPRDAAYSVWPFRSEPNGALLGWYCNLQCPLVRTDRGFDTNDWTLDIWASPDLSNWFWKDEDEFEFGQEVGLYSPEDVVKIRAVGAAVIELIKRRDAIFDQWRDWTAPSDWLTSPPTLSA